VRERALAAASRYALRTRLELEEKARGQLMLKVAAGLVVCVLAAAAGFTWGTLRWTYSDGQRAGYVQKLARKGWLCKTWEGEMVMAATPGTMLEKFKFTVHDDGLAAGLSATAGQRMALHYEQHKGIPGSCFGDSEYFVTSARRITD
jgi:hypothetical protein